MGVVGTIAFNATSGRTERITAMVYEGGPIAFNNSNTAYQDPITPFFDTQNYTTGPELCWGASPGGALVSENTTYSSSLLLSSEFDASLELTADIIPGFSVSGSPFSYSNELASAGGH
jgi:hypothetical protein